MPHHIVGSGHVRGILPLLLCGALLSCGGSPPPVRPPITPKIDSAPPLWIQGEYPTEEAFFGHGQAPMEPQGPEATQATARQGGLNNIKLEMNLLVQALKDDYEKVTASGPGWYDRYAMFDRFDDAARSSLEKAAVAETWTDNRQKPPVVHVLVRLPVGVYYEMLFAIKEIPDEPKQRIKNYERTLTRAVMGNLGR